MLALQSHSPARITFAKVKTLLLVESGERKLNPILKSQMPQWLADFILVNNVPASGVSRS